MRYFVFLFCAGNVAFCGSVGVGVIAGVPATGLVMSSDHDSGVFPATGSRVVIGPTVDIRLPFGLAVEVDALYRRVKDPSGSSWEFPILAKYRPPVRGPVTPFVVGGGSFQRNDLLRAVQVGPAETAAGFLCGAGLEARLRVIRLAPQFRYTRWTGDFSFRGDRLVHRNQVEFLVGLTF